MLAILCCLNVNSHTALELIHIGMFCLLKNNSELSVKMVTLFMVKSFYFHTFVCSATNILFFPHSLDLTDGIEIEVM